MIDDLDNVTWSWSRVDYTCLADFYQNYVLKKEQEANNFSNLGTFCHDIVEKVGKGEITHKEGLEMFKKDFWTVAKRNPITPTKFWTDPEGSYYKKLLPFFERKKWWTGTVVSVEEYVEGTLPSGEKIRGYIDQMFSYRRQLGMRDFKIATPYKGEKLKEKFRQMYLYSYLYHQIHGSYPKKLEFVWFKDKDKPTTVKFDEKEMWDTIDFVEGRIEKLKKLLIQSKKRKGLFPPIDFNNYFCKEICSFRNNCAFKQ